MQLTNEEIQFIKKMYADSVALNVATQIDTKVEQAMKIITDKYQPLLDQAEQDGDLDTRKSLIEQMTLEAKAKEEEIRNT